MLGAEHTSCQSPIWGFPSFPWFFKIFHFYLFLLPEIWLVRIRKKKPVSKKFSDYCCYFSFIDYWCNYVNQSIQSTGPSYSDTSTRTRTGTDSKILTIEPDNLMDNNYSCLTKIFFVWIDVIIIRRYSISLLLNFFIWWIIENGISDGWVCE